MSGIHLNHFLTMLAVTAEPLPLLFNGNCWLNNLNIKSLSLFEGFFGMATSSSACLLALVLVLVLSLVEEGMLEEARLSICANPSQYL